MARIRSIKPEFWTDRKLARLSRDARLLYISLWNLADEHGRVHGDTRYIKGHCLPYDDDLSLAAVDGLLRELELASRVHRYEVDGDPFLFLPKLASHQRLEPTKVPSRLPEPPAHAQNTPDTPSSEPRADSSARDADLSEPSVALQVAGSRLQVAGSRAQDSAAQITGEYVANLRKKPPQQVVAQLAHVIKQLIVNDEIDPEDVRAGLALWHAKAGHPNALPSFVNEAMNRPPPTSVADSRVLGYLALADKLSEGEPA